MGTNRSAWIETGLPTAIALVGAIGWSIWARSYFAPLTVAPRDFGIASPHPARVASSSATTCANPITLPNASSAPIPDMPGDWPGFRGANHDAIAPATTIVGNSPTAIHPIWQVKVGEGYASPCIKAGRVFLLDHDASTDQDVLRCFALADGRELWRTGYSAPIKRNHGISRTVPATDGKNVVTLGPKCMVLCADAITGKPKWQIDLVAKYGVTVPEWYAGQCPLIDDGKVVLATGGQRLFVALDVETGKPAWETPNPKNWTMTHGSLAIDQTGGIKTYVCCFGAGVAAVAAKDGSLCWSTESWVVNTATVPTPVSIGDGRIFLCGGYNAGSMMLRVTNSGGRWSAKELFRLDPAVFGSDQQTPVLFQGHLFGVKPGGELTCLDLSGKPCWTSGTEGRFGLGPYMIADGKVLLMNDSGKLTIAEASTTSFHSFGSITVLPGPESWGPMAVAGQRLLVRDSGTLLCLELGKA